MDSRSTLFAFPDPYDLEGSRPLFLRAIEENVRFHYNACPEYRKIAQARGFSPHPLQTERELAELPILPTILFKRHDLRSMEGRKLLITATSSGTGGTPSSIQFDMGGLFYGLRMVLRLGRYHHLFSPIPTNYVVMGYKPQRDNHAAAVKTAFGATLFTPAVRRRYALLYRDGKYVPDLDGVIQAIVSYSQSSLPTRFMGFPSYTYFVLRRMEEQGITVKLKPGSKIMLGGGWKQFYAQQVDKKALYALAKRVLDLSEKDFIEFFGAVEHPILYCSCPNHHFHIPVYSRVIIRDVHTLQPLPYGCPGLVNLITPMVKGAPLTSVMTDDLGVLHEPNSCGCSISAPWLELLGRVGLKGLKTCAAGAAELLSEVKL